MKVFRCILITSLTLFALQSAIEQALVWYQSNELIEHPNALKTLEEEAKNGNNSAAFLLATAYKNGKLGSVDFDKAYTWYELAASRGDGDAMLMLGWLNYEGKTQFGVQSQRAYYWFEKAARQGVDEAVDMLELLKK